MKILNRIIDICLVVLSAAAAIALGFLLIAICYATFSRFAFNKPLSNLVEYASYSLISGVVTVVGTQVACGNFVNQIKVMDSMGTPQYLLTMTIPLGMAFMSIQFLRNGASDYKLLKELRGRRAKISERGETL